MQDFGWGLNIGVIILAAGLARGIVPLMRARSRIGNPPSTEGTDPELARTVDALQGRVAELEERLDFAERMLATHRDGERLGPPKP